jgi:hypothetical protein
MQRCCYCKYERGRAASLHELHTDSDLNVRPIEVAMIPRGVFGMIVLLYHDQSTGSNGNTHSWRLARVVRRSCWIERPRSRCDFSSTLWSRYQRPDISNRNRPSRHTCQRPSNIRYRGAQGRQIPSLRQPGHRWHSRNVARAMRSRNELIVTHLRQAADKRCF